MDRRAYLISVFDDTLERINGDFDLHKAQQQSIAAQKLILEKEALEIPAPRFGEKIAQQQQAMDEEQQDDSCFTADVPECQFVRGH